MDNQPRTSPSDDGTQYRNVILAGNRYVPLVDNEPLEQYAVDNNRKRQGFNLQTRIT